MMLHAMRIDGGAASGPPRISYSLDGLRRTSRSVTARIDEMLTRLHEAGRKSVAIVDTACGQGQLLLHAARKARALGFVAIEAKGFDPSPENIEAAWRTAMATRDPAIGYSFMAVNDAAALPLEDHDADLAIGDHDVPDLHRIAIDDDAIILSGARPDRA